MKAKFLAPLCLLLVSGLSTRAQGPAQDSPIGIAATPASAEKIRGSYQITSMVCLQDSGGQSQRVFVNADVFVGQLNPEKYKLMLSSSPDADAPYIVDDAVFVNGQKFPGHISANAPYFHLTEDPAAIYEGVPAVEVTGCLRRDGHVFVQCMDLGGGVFGCSALYLRVVPR